MVSMVIKWSVAMFLVACVASITYTNTLDGKFVFDDHVAVLKNPVVTGKASLVDILERDYWGDMLSNSNSHKSWRPVTTFSFRINYMMTSYEGGELNSFYFHVTNIFIHVCCSILTISVTRECFSTFFVLTSQERINISLLESTVVGLLFATSPVHTEAIANIASRADCLMSLFYLAGFLLFTKCVKSDKGSIVYALVAVVSASVFTTLALLSKETGITLPLMCLVWDIVTNIVPLQTNNRSKLSSSRCFWLRSIGLILITIMLAWFRIHKNGITSVIVPFGWNQNRAALHQKPLYRALSVCWIWIFALWTMFGFGSLCCDWSGGSIPTVESMWDVRAIMVVMMWIMVALGTGQLFRIWNDVTVSTIEIRAYSLSTAFIVLPYVLSSNLLFPVGTLFAERLLYLPTLGVCMIIAKSMKHVTAYMVGKLPSSVSNKCYCSNILFVALCGVLVMSYGQRSRIRGEDWRGPIRLLESTTSLLPTHSHSALALLCSIGKIPHPMFEERTVALMSKIATIISDCPSSPVGWNFPSTQCMDVGEPRVTWRLATCLRLGSFGQAAEKLMQSEEDMLDDMRSWRSKTSGSLSALDLLSPRENQEASAELAMGRCVAKAELYTSQVKRVEIATEVLGTLSLLPFHSSKARSIWKQILEIEKLVSDSAPRPDTRRPRWEELRQFLAEEC